MQSLPERAEKEYSNKPKVTGVGERMYGPLRRMLWSVGYNMPTGIVKSGSARLDSSGSNESMQLLGYRG